MSEDNTDKTKEFEEKLRLQQEEINRLNAEKAGLEGSLSTFKETISTFQQRTQQQPQDQWTEDQWKDFEEQNGVSRQQLKLWGSLNKAQTDVLATEIKKEISKRDEKISEYEKKLAALDSQTKISKVRKVFFKDNPALSRYENDINEYLSDIPGIEEDPEKYKKALAKAEIYVRGKVSLKGEKMPKFGKGGDVPEDEDESVDFSAFERGERHLLERIHSTSKKEDADILKAHAYKLDPRRGVQVSDRDKFDKARAVREGSRK